MNKPRFNIRDRVKITTNDHYKDKILTIVKVTYINQLNKYVYWFEEISDGYVEDALQLLTEEIKPDANEWIYILSGV